jgi:predicted metalloprotease
MRWQEGRRSDNIEDRRGLRPATGIKVGGLGILAVVVVGYLMGASPTQILQFLAQTQTSVDRAPVPSAPQAPTGYDQESDFISVVLGSTEDTWTQLFTRLNRQYHPPRLVLFTEAVDSACGLNSAAVGPFYCPLDSQVYLDLGFFRELRERFGAPGDFAQAYVVAHEVGHHVQNLLGISDKIQDLRARASEVEANALSVRQELQADCFAGVWGHAANQERNLLEPGDVEEGLSAAAAIGDDRLQRQGSGYVNPESWTHGSSDQRVQWLRRGLESGRLDACDTFRNL